MISLYRTARINPYFLEHYQRVLVQNIHHKIKSNNIDKQFNTLILKVRTKLLLSQHRNS